MLKPGSILLGVDPGFVTAGFSVLAIGSAQTITMLESDFLALSSSKTITERIALFYEFFNKKMSQWQVTDIAIETPFLGKNVQNFLKLGYLRGILHLLSAQSHIPIHEFTPMQVKLALTGSGNASKDQVAYMVKQLFPRFVQSKKLDVTDAIAVALCAVWQQKRLAY